MTKKYELTDETINRFGRTLYRIRALVSFGIIDAGEKGGFVEKEENLNQEGNAWVYGDAEVYGNARVSGDARVSGNARVSKRTEIMWVSNIGSENGTLTVTRSKDGNLFLSRGCFSGDLEQFEKAVTDTHGDSDYGKQYKVLIDFIKLRFNTGDVAND